MESRILLEQIEILNSEIKKIDIGTDADADARERSELFRLQGDSYVSLFNITQDFLHLSLADTYYQSAIDALVCMTLKPSIYLRLSLFAVRQDKAVYESDKSQQYISALNDYRNRTIEQMDVCHENPFNSQSYIDQPTVKSARKK